jgi:hypothetical protein
MFEEWVRSRTAWVSAALGVAVGLVLWLALRSLPVAIAVAAGVAMLTYVGVGNVRAR